MQQKFEITLPGGFALHNLTWNEFLRSCPRGIQDYIWHTNVDSYNQGYSQGHQDGCNKGQSDSYDDGYKSGYEDGYAAHRLETS